MRVDESYYHDDSYAEVSRDVNRTKYFPLFPAITESIGIGTSYNLVHANIYKMIPKSKGLLVKISATDNEEWLVGTLMDSENMLHNSRQKLVKQRFSK